MPVTRHVLTITGPFKTNDHYAMKLLPIIVFSISVLLIHRASGQELPRQFDTLPQLKPIDQPLPFLDEVRCVAYLYGKDFIVYDSLQYIYVDLYVNDEWSWKEKRHYDAISDKIYLAVYKISIHEHLAFFQRNFRAFIVRFFDVENKLLNEKWFPIERGGLLTGSIRNIELTCGSLRFPTTWGVEGKKFRTCTFCADLVEAEYFYRVLYRHFIKLDFLQKKWKQWNQYFLSCTGRTRIQYTIPLR